MSELDTDERSVVIRQVRKALDASRDGRGDDVVHTLSFLVDWLELREEPHEAPAA